MNGVYSAGVEPTEEAEEEQLSTATPDTPTVDEPVGSTTPTRSDQDRGARRPELRPCLRAALVVVGLAGIAIVAGAVVVAVRRPNDRRARSLLGAAAVAFVVLEEQPQFPRAGQLSAQIAGRDQRLGRHAIGENGRPAESV